MISRLNKFREETKSVRAEVHTNRSDENERTVRKTANYGGEIIHELGNATWCDQGNESNQAGVEKEEKTYSSLMLGIITEMQGKPLLLAFPYKLSF